MEKSLSGSNVWDSRGLWNPWHVLRVKVNENSIPVDLRKNKRLGKGGMSVLQQSAIIKPLLLEWWEKGNWCPYDSDEIDFKHCNLPPHRITNKTSVRMVLKNCDEKYQVFLFYAVQNPRKGVVTASIMGVITREEIRNNKELVRISNLHRTREIGAEEFRQKMREIYVACEKDKVETAREVNLKRCIFPFPLKRRLLAISKKEKITLDEVYTRMVKFVSAMGWDEKVNDDQTWDEWRPPSRPKWFTCKPIWSKHEFTSRHQHLRRMSEYIDIAGYLVGGIAAATNPEYAKMRHLAERRRLEFFFTKCFDTEESVRCLIKENGMEELLDKEIDKKTLEEYKRRNPIERKVSTKIISMTPLFKSDNSTTNPSSTFLQKIIETEKEQEENISTALPKYYGVLHVTDCPPSILEDGASLIRGNVKIFYNDVKEVILYWMEIDQIYTNATVRLNPSSYQHSHLHAFADDAIITKKAMQKRAKKTKGGRMHGVNLSIQSGETGKYGNLDIDIEELLELSPPCITQMLKA